MISRTSAGDRLDPEKVHDILRNDRRRKALEYLRKRLEPVALRDLAERIAAWEAGESPPPTNVRQSVYNSLHQTHLPKLDAVGIVEYNKDRKRVKLCERARQLDPYMDVVTGLGITWSTYYRTIGILALFAVVASEASVPVFSTLDPLVIATVFLFVYAGSTAYQLWSRRWLYMRSIVGD